MYYVKIISGPDGYITAQATYQDWSCEVYKNMLEEEPWRYVSSGNAVSSTLSADCEEGLNKHLGNIRAKLSKEKYDRAKAK